MPTDRECRRCAREIEYNGSMAALEMWEALTLVAAMAPATEDDVLRQRRAVAQMHNARARLGDNNRDAARKIEHHGPQRAFETFDPQMRLVA